jgi:peptidyl-prolyl cis-trans isomerase A (cyclophilin A)/peptidyl-prolyl cis-trans isomerase B (cyclophilin B)
MQETIMKHLLVALIGFISFGVYAANPRVEMQTSQGNIIIELYPDKAPKTVENFLHYANNGFYDGTIFHRVINNFVIQGGGYTPDLNYKPTDEAIPNEATNGLLNEPGTLAMARGPNPDSATSQFFINLDSNKFLNHYRKHPDYYGYAVFGKVVEGMDVVTKIATTPTTASGMFKAGLPTEAILIQRVTLLPSQDYLVTAEPAVKPKGKSNGKASNKSRRHLTGT